MLIHNHVYRSIDMFIGSISVSNHEGFYCDSDLNYYVINWQQYNFLK